MTRKKAVLLAVGVLAAALVSFTMVGSGAGGYEVKLVMPNATNVVKGAPVEIRGSAVGKVADLQVRGNKAVVTIGVDSAAAPLPTGTKGNIRWRSTLGERVIDLVPGPASNPDVPSGGMIDAGPEQVEVDQLLAAMDAPTRAHLSSMVQQLHQTLDAGKGDVHDTLKTAGPAVGALGQVLKSVGEDGPAIQNLVTDLQKMTKPLSERKDQLGRVVDNTAALTAAAAPKERKLGEALGELPLTLSAARKTLDKVPGAVDQAKPLLDDLRPATSELKSVSQNLSPLLADLRPTVAQLRPTLASASSLLQQTPGLMDSAHAVVPEASKAVNQLNPAVDFLRPYTPDLAGWLSNWGNAFAGYDSQGHIFHGLIQAGAASLENNPGARVGYTNEQRPAPGIASPQPWTDANGSGVR